MKKAPSKRTAGGWGGFRALAAVALALLLTLLVLTTAFGNVAGENSVQTAPGNPPVVTSIEPPQGAWGNKVSATIQGQYLNTTTAGWLSKTGQPNISFNNIVVVSDTSITCDFDIPNNAELGKWDVNVDNGTPPVGVLANGFEIFSVWPPPMPEPTTWYLAEGTTSWGFDTYISIMNPNDTAVTAAVTYMTTGGPVNRADVTLPAMSQATINPENDIGSQDFSTKVECKEGKAIAVDRTMTWTGPGAASEEAHNSIGVTSPNNTWYLAEGSSAWGFECWLLIQNPNTTEATCQVTYMVEGAGPHTVTKKIPANSRRSYNIADDIENHDASIKVDADIPVIPERAMYRNNRREGHDSIGTVMPANDYYLAEGTTAWGFTTYVLIQNPNLTETDVTVTYMTPTGPVTHPENPIRMPANTRKTIRVNDFLQNTDLSTKVHGSQPIIAERAMYWGANTILGEACHDSIGMDLPQYVIYLPDGQTSQGRETWTLVQNPGEVPLDVTIKYLTPTGQDNKTVTDQVPASSRKTYPMSDKISSGRAAILVECSQPAIVERAMYWNNRGAGTDTIGGTGAPPMPPM